MAHSKDTKSKTAKAATSASKAKATEAKATNSANLSVGETLKSIRLEKGLLIEEVFNEIKISTAFLEALEENNYDDLPGEVYVVGFVRSYADFLNIEPEPLIAKVRAHFGYERRALEPLPAPYQSDSIMPSSSVLWLLVLVVVVGIVWWAYFVSMKPEVLLEGEEAPFASEEALPLNEIEPSAGKLDFTAAELERMAGQPLVKESAEDEIPADLLAAAKETVQGIEESATQKAQAQSSQAASAIATPSVPSLSARGPEGQRVMFKATGEVWFQVRQVGTDRVLTNKTLQAGDVFWIDQLSDVVADIGKPESLQVFVDGQFQGFSSLRGGIVKGLDLSPKFLVKDYFGNKIHLPDDYKDNG